MRLSMLLIMILVAAMEPGIAEAGHRSGGHGKTDVLDEVTVIAERIREYGEKNPHQVTRVERDEIVERNFLNVNEILNSMPGVEILPSAGIGSRISIRGSGKSGGVLVLLNGRPLNTSQYGGVDLGAIPVDVVKSVAVFKPPVPVWLGAGAGDGAISIVTHDFKAEKKGKTRLKFEGGSYGLARASASHMFSRQGSNYMLTGSGTRKDGKRHNHDKNQGAFSLHWDKKTTAEGGYDVNGRFYISEHGSPGPEDNPTPDARQRYAKTSFDVKRMGYLGDNGDYSLKAYMDMVDLKDESQSGTTSDLENVRIGLKSDTLWSEENGLWEMRVGGILEYDEADHTLTGRHDRVTAGIHTQFDRSFGPVTASIGGRCDHTEDFGINPGFSGGLSYAITPESSIKAGAGYTVKIPTFGQLYQPSHGSIDQVRGNPELDEEKISSCDIGWEYRFGKEKVLQATLFRTDTRDLIVYQRGSDLVYKPVNTGKARRQGVELTMKYAWDERLAAEISCIFQDSRNRGNGKDLAYTPRHKFKTTLKYSVPRFDTRIELLFRYEDERYSESENSEAQKLSDYAAVDLKILQAFKVKDKDCTWFLDLHNLFDKDYESHYGYPDEGVRFVTGLHVTY